MNKHTRTVPRVCEHCGGDFLAAAHEVARGNGRFCNKSCATKALSRARRQLRSILPHPTDPDARLIPLTRGKFAIVDAGDAERVASVLWTATGRDGRWYGYRKMPDTGATESLQNFVLGLPHSEVVDHAAGNGLDCRRRNLRHTDRTGNGCNKRISRRNKSGYKGVTFFPETGRWAAKIKFRNRQRHIGYFATPEAAAQAYDAAARELHGEFACVNFPLPGERGAR
jgi:hypothetical protein